MNGLTQEQLLKIEENKRAAERKRQNGALHHSDACKHTANSQFQKFQSPLPKKTVYPSMFDKRVGKAGAALGSVGKVVSATFHLISTDRFSCEMGFHDPSIEVMKSISGRVFDNASKRWTFPLSEHDSLFSKLSSLKPEVTVTSLPRNILNAFKVPVCDYQVDISKIDELLLRSLLPFQIDGVRFGVSRKGRCLIADDMGLGKTIQALGIAHYYVEKWPLLIVCPSSMRFPWEEAIHLFLPSVNPFYVCVMTASSDLIHEAKVVIASYDLLKTCLDVFKLKKFGVIIFDESHFLKNAKSARTKAAMELAPRAHNLILLSGTPALSRPQELYPQIQAIDPTCFKNFNDFGMRYCAGHKTRFGWDYSGSSNAVELELLLKRKFMLRRLKSEVLEQLPSKLRKLVVLHPKMVKAVSQQMDQLATQMAKQRGMEKRGTLFQYYSATGTAKLPAVKEYLEDKLECPGKMLVFAHHAHVIDCLCELLINKRVDHIRIDGATSSEARAQLCEQFQTSPEIRVAVLSIKAANSGITLTAAQLVLFAELYWNPGELTQAEDRAHRIGQKDSVVVEYLLAKGTADDHLWSLIQSKLNVLNSVGLSKDNFKNADTEELVDKHQQKLPEMFASNKVVPEEGKTDSTSTFSDSQMNNLLSDLEGFNEAFDDDDLFDSVDLADIEYKCEPKRQKT